MSWILRLISEAMMQMLLGAVKLFADFVNNIFLLMYQCNQELKIEKVGEYTTLLACSLVGFYAVKRGIDTYVLKTSGDSDADALEEITRISVAIAVILCGNFILQELVKVAAIIADDFISKVIKNDISFSEALENIINTVSKYDTVEGFLIVVFLVVIEVSFFIFVFKAARRGAELILFEIILPIAACDLLTTNKERWNAFFTELMICIFGYILQLMSFNIFMVFFVDIMKDPFNIKLLVVAISWLMLVLSVPKWIQKFTYSSGLGGTLKGGLRTVIVMAPGVIRHK